MNPIQYLGARFDGLGFPPDAYTEEHRQWLADEGETPDFTIELNDKSLEFLLDTDRVVTTIFVRDKAAIDQLVGAETSEKMTEKIEQRLGVPTTSGVEKSVPILGRKGGWLRYDYPSYSMHLQKAVGGEIVEMVTLTIRK